jgi:hypothetical protein
MKHLYNLSGKPNVKWPIVCLSLLLIMCASRRHTMISNTEIGHFSGKLPAPQLHKGFIYLTSQIVNGSKVELRFPTPAKMNVSHFVVQRSEDGANYEDAALIFVPDWNVTIKHYKYTDKINSLEENGLIYYRIKIVDVNGRCEYSDVSIVSFESRNNGFAFADDFGSSDDYEYWCTLAPAHAGIPLLTAG